MTVGMIRYSVEAAFNHDRPESVRDVFADPYFTERFEMFRGITLPSFAQQTNKNFILLVYHSHKMPVEKKKLFADIERDFPFVRNIYVYGGKLNIPSDLRQARTLSFRIDNDDGVPTDFIDRLRAAAQLHGKKSDNFALTIPHMRKVRRIGENEFQTLDCDFVANSMGLAYLGSDGRSVMDLGNHRLFPYNAPTLFIEGNGGLQIINGTNVANGFNKVYDKQSALKTMTELELQKLLSAEGYAKINLMSLPIIKQY